MTQTFDSLVQKIHRGASPYAGFSFAGWPQERGPNWDADHPWFTEAIEELHPQIIIEVGSFLGRSAINMGRQLKRLNLDSAIVCVDTFLGDDLLWESEWRPQLHFRNGRPEFYNLFLRNVIETGMADVIVPLPIASPAAARLLKRLGVQAQMVYLDGSHARGDVARDIEMYWRLLTPGSIMLLDDYENKTINSAVADDLLDFVGHWPPSETPIEINGLKARIRKPR